MKSTTMIPMKPNPARTLLVAGSAVAPLFYIASVVQAALREGFDIHRHAISTLTLGSMGWIQSLCFTIAGLLAISASAGTRAVLRGKKGRLWGPLLIAVFGIGMIGAGWFKPDPGLSFPPGAPDGPPTGMSVHAAMHSAAFFIAFLCLIAASFVFAHVFALRGDRRWQRLSIGAGILSPLLIALGMASPAGIGLLMALAGLVSFGWLSALSIRLLSGLA